MKVQVFIVFIHVLLCTYAITVPPVWPKQTKYEQPSTHKPIRNRPYRQNIQKPVLNIQKPAINIQHPAVNIQNPINIQDTVFQTESSWIPVTAYPLQQPVRNQFVVHPTPRVRPISRPIKLQKRPTQVYRGNYVSHADKNIPFSPVRGSHIHKIPSYTPGTDNHYVISNEHKLPNDHDIKPNYNSPVSEHEIPKDIPTRPIYPGEGQWARPGVKHRPYISTQKYTELPKDDDKPDGYDIFERGQDRFKQAQNKFNYKLANHPKNHRTEKINSDYSDQSNTNSEDDFIPQKLYSQVRRTETKQHLPRSQIDNEEENAAKLREIIKDSKIQTVYSEEGYEDSAYDHAGKEKKAESEEGHSHKGEEVEKAGKHENANRDSKHNQERGRNRGQAKYRRTKNKNDRLNTRNYDNIESYEDIMKKVEQEGKQELESASSEYAIKVPLTKKVGSQRNLQTTKDIQKVEIKTSMKNGDDVNMEIHTEVKINPDKKKHKFIKIVPSYKKIETADLNSSNFQKIDESSSEKNVVKRRVKRYNKEKLSRIYIRKRPDYYWRKRKTFSSKTFIKPGKTKNINSDYTTVTNGKLSTTSTKTTTTTTKTTPVIVKIKKTRYKRYAIDHPDISVPTEDFNVDKIQIKPQKIKAQKYPYLNINSKNLHENSPLRYAEDLEKIPKKTQNQMAFYDSTSNVKCAAVEEDVDPVPDRIKNKKENDDVQDDGEEIEQESNGPRLEGLGDKIDCLKIKYFGEDPLDSPIFREESINIPIPPAFKNVNKGINKPVNELNQYKRNKLKDSESINESKFKNNLNTSENFNLNSKISKKRDLKHHPIIVDDENISTTITINPLTEQAEAVLKPPYTFKEMVEKLMKNKTIPKSIYDQISLLETSEEIISKEKETPKFLIIYDNQSGEPKKEHENLIKDTINNLTPTTKGYIDPRVSDVIPNLSNLSQKLPVTEILNLIPENFTEYQLIVPNKETRSNSPESTTFAPLLPTFAALTEKEKEDRPYHLPIIVPVDYKNSLNIPKKSNKYPSFIFDISKYLPQIKNHKIITSEVQYKDEIKPSEQMNVYSDVLKAINISTQEVTPDNSQPITVRLQVNKTRNYPKRRVRIKTTPMPKTIRIKKPEGTKSSSSNKNMKEVPNTQKTTPQVFPTEEPTPPKTLPQKIQNMINQYSNPLLINVPDILYSQENSQEKEITGLAPPTNHYRTIQPSPFKKPENTRHSRNINNFYVVGMRPPIQNQLPLFYNDYASVRSKRDTRRPMYTEIIRSRPSRPQNEERDEEEEEEDLKPRKRIYGIKPRQRTTTTEKEEDYEIIYETEQPRIEKPTLQPPIFERPTGLPDYIKIIDKLHEYRFKNNITTTLPEQETTTANPRATTTTTARTQLMAESVNVRRGEPTYLQIINQLHEVRKAQEPPTTTEEPEEYPQVPVQNSNPYIVAEAEALTRNNNRDRDEDIESYVRNLSSKFRTSIDTSKYKTIERMPVVVRHNLSSRFNSEDEVLPLERMFTTKMPVIFSTTIRNSELLENPDKDSESREEEEKSRTPQIKIKQHIEDTISEESTTSTKAPRRRTRPRTRPTTTATTRHVPTPNPAFRRRRPTTASTTTTTTEVISTQRNPIFTRRRLRPKPSPVSDIPPNHKREYVPVSELPKFPEGFNDEVTQRPTDKKKRRLEKLHERRLSSEYSLTRYYPELDEEPIEEIQNKNEDKKSEFEIIGVIKNPEMRHGGNYRHITDAPKIENDNQDFENSGLIDQNSNTLKGYSTSDIIVTEIPEKVSTWKPNFTPNLNKNLRTADDDFNTDESVISEKDKSVTQIKPKIIKDPSKRNYFYARL